MSYTAIERALTKMVKKYHPGLAIVHFDTLIINWIRVMYPHNTIPSSTGLYAILKGALGKLDWATLYCTPIDPATDNWASPLLDQNGKLLESWQKIADFTQLLNESIKELKKAIKQTHIIEFSPCNYVTSELMLVCRPKTINKRAVTINLDYNRRPESLMSRSSIPLVHMYCTFAGGLEPRSLMPIDSKMINLNNSLKIQQRQLTTTFEKIKRRLYQNQ